jgi:hypothetical protein
MSNQLLDTPIKLFSNSLLTKQEETKKLLIFSFGLGFASYIIWGILKMIFLSDPDLNIGNPGASYNGQSIMRADYCLCVFFVSFFVITSNIVSLNHLSFNIVFQKGIKFFLKNIPFTIALLASGVGVIYLLFLVFLGLFISGIILIYQSFYLVEI